MSKSRTLVCIVLIGLIFMLSCNEKEPNPCDTLVPFEASFSMGVHFSGGYGEWEIDSLIASDTVISKKYIAFEADEVYDSYEWKIGNDPTVFTTNRVFLLFRLPEDSLKVQLIAKKTPNLDCFPNDDGIDTVVHYLTIIKREDNPIIGTYSGYLESDPNSVMEVEIIFEPDVYGYQILNINKGCNPMGNNYPIGVDHRSTFKVIYFASNLNSGSYSYQNNCLDPRGWAVLDSLGEFITISFSKGSRSKIEYFPENRTYDTYHGEKPN